jgi:hypothetical protein
MQEKIYFGRHKKTKDGLDSWCSNCRNEYAKTPRRLETARIRRRSSKSLTKRRAERLKKFGLTPEQYDIKLISQNGCCAICRKPETSRDPRYGTLKHLSVDHDHDTGIIRELLCDRCNTSIGKFDDNSELLYKAGDYLRKHGK